MLPYGRQTIDEDDIEAVADVLRSDFLTCGPKIEEFEGAIKAATGAEHAVACSNGTAALQMAALATKLGPGDAAIVPSLTFLATANAVRHTGADVVFCDVDPQTGLMGPDHLVKALERSGNDNIKAVFPVHLTGKCADLKKIKEIASNHNLKIIADSCHAIGGEYQGDPVGSCQVENMNVFSFHPVKTIAAGEGGAVTTNNKDDADFMRRMRNHGVTHKREPNPWYYEMKEIGYNYRITDIQCALGISQMKKLEKFVTRRRKLVAQYDALLEQLDPVITPPVKVPDCNPAWHLYAPKFDFRALNMTRAELMNTLKNKGIGTQVHYIPVHHQPYYKKLYGDIALPGADEYYERTLSLPLFPGMKDEDVAFVVDTLKEITGGP